MIGMRQQGTGGLASERSFRSQDGNDYEAMAPDPDPLSNHIGELLPQDAVSLARRSVLLAKLQLVASKDPEQSNRYSQVRE
jgi:hypothetical protein